MINLNCLISRLRSSLWSSLIDYFSAHQVAATAVLPAAASVPQAACARARLVIPAVVSEAWCMTDNAVIPYEIGCTILSLDLVLKCKKINSI